ncbi:epoxyqueuosine reductase QueH [uncultured Sphaerochaeta sp.]|uniref:epoxyqueuosine reductase QueH n=1 Tax=uncultured Sphaerochaeta sp. TaxID=886478 RepID=UPI002A0A31AC|nr:epoxyqueuosine reductase QueH [uncultured Sphaerochaeta sp.]
MNEKEILVHACCGPCSTASIERLIAEGWKPVLFFGNSNIFPSSEADKRFEELLKVAKAFDLQVIRQEQDHEAWLTQVAGLEGEKEGGARCEKCFLFNLREASRKAEELGFSHFCTTLTVSRFKNSKMIFKVGEQFPSFEAIDFKKKGGFDRSLVMSKEMHLYRQNYCGCEFSLHD